MDITRRDLAGLAASALVAKPSVLLAQAAPSPGPRLDIAEWSYFWVGTEHISLPRGTVANGMQMYVEYQVPARPAHPYPIVLVHGGASQGTDWISTPDGRRGWASLLLDLGY